MKRGEEVRAAEEGADGKAGLALARTISLNQKLADAHAHENDSHFICTICFKVLHEPMECAKCQTSFCADCIDGWKRNNRTCPVRCEYASYKEMHKFVRQILYEHRFFCPMEHCPQHKKAQVEKVRNSAEKVNFMTLGLPYKEALEHQQKCLLRKRTCPKRCGEKIYGKDVESHLKLCKNFEKVCPKCEISSFPNRDNAEEADHDCFKALLAKTKSNAQELSELKWQLGTNYETLNSKCSSGKPLKVHRGLVLSYLSESRDKRPKCNECAKPNLDMHDFFYRCAEWSTCRCNWDLCRHCALISCDPPVLAATQKFKFHKCELTRHSKDMPDWCCAVADKEKFPLGTGECETGMVNSDHSTHV